ncbi:MAG: tol-pal system-associated acyl-CoA thioesterase [Methylococcaceae bacterium]
MKKFHWPVRVYYEDTDSGGMVYHANYLKFFERTRTEYLRALGYELDDVLHRMGVMFVVKSLTIEYLKPAHFNDALTATAAVTLLRPASLVFSQTLLRGDEETLSAALIKVVCLRADGVRPVAIPEPLLQSLKHEF